jgi:antitoxin (DNA-binding transcriptional repressor) of toxin-antitoxin stability system
VAKTQSISASEFKAKCLGILDQLAGHELERVVITKRGRIVGVLTPPDETQGARELHGFMRGSVTIPPAFDLTAPVSDEPFDAERGDLHAEASE